MDIHNSIWVNKAGCFPLFLGIFTYLVFSHRLPKAVRNFVVTATASATIGCLMFGSPFSNFAGEVISSRAVAEPTGVVTNEKHILFIGNSYTFYNNMPDMVTQIAKSDPENHTRFVVQSFTWGGANLQGLWNDGRALKLIKSKHWDDVVLQEQSYWAMLSQSVDNTSRYAQRFDEAIKQGSGQTLLFTTWARQPGSKFYCDKETSFLQNPVYMQEQFNLNTKQLSRRLGAVAIPVGDYWAAALKRLPGLSLYLEDGSHPSPTGSYLTALAFYRHFSGRPLHRADYVPSGVLPEHAAFLRGLVSE